MDYEKRTKDKIDDLIKEVEKKRIMCLENSIRAYGRVIKSKNNQFLQDAEKQRDCAQELQEGIDLLVEARKILQTF